MADVIWSCPQCGIDLKDDGDESYCIECDQYFTPPAIMVPGDE